jgi:hypothetical protein
MPIVRCSRCGDRISIKAKDRKLIIMEEEYVCSAGCLLSWICSWEAPICPIALDCKHVSSGEFKSQYEVDFSKWLTRNGIRWEYERWGFPVGDNGHYTPDFFCMQFGCFVETKGIWGVGAKTKFRKFRLQYPNVPIIVASWILRADIPRTEILR